MDSRIRRAGSSLTTVLVAVLVVGMLLLAIVVWRQQRTETVRDGRDDQPIPPADSSPARTSDVSAGSTDGPIRGLPILARKPKPVAMGFKDCPAEGDGGDRQQNRLKNRIDSTTWLPAEFDAVRTLAWPRIVGRRQRDGWTWSERNAVAKFEGLPLSVEGYFAGAKQEGPEASNCHGADAEYRDWHMWLAPEPGRDRTHSIVVETTPGVRAIHTGWSLTMIRRLARDSTRVRVSGWLFLDPEHPEQVGKTRGTIWEIHPVMRIEAWRNGRWEEVE